MNNLERRIKKLTDELERIEFEHSGGRKAYYDRLLAEHKQVSKAAFEKLCNSVGVEPLVVRQEAHDTNNSQIGVLCQYMGMEVREFKRLLMERISNSGR